MSGEPGTDEIQLHFCPVCGVSVPQADIDAERAKIEPDTCAFFSQPARCPVKLPRTETAPAAPAAARPAAAVRNGGGGIGLVWGIALLYVVGATTFLLFRDFNRAPPRIELPPVATAKDVRSLAAKIAAIDKQSRDTLQRLASNDAIQREDLAKLNDGLNRLQRKFEDQVGLVRVQHKDLQDSIVVLSERTVGIKNDASDILRRLNGIAEQGGGRPANAAPGNQPPPVVQGEPEEKDAPTPPPPVDPEIRKQVDQFIKQLLDRSVDKQTRFNAAVQLGDLMDPSSVDALITALKKDRYDLVRRAAAYSLGMLGKHSVKAIPDLIRQMDDKEEYVGYMCERALGDITKVVLGAPVSFGFDPTMNSRKRRAVQKKWEGWWEKNKESVLRAG